MKILMSGGTKTQNIVNAIEKQFRASGDEFIVIEYIEDISSIFARGEYFDKAIIAEQSITRDGSITDEYEIRERVSKFALEFANRPQKLSYVFFTQSEDIANMIHDEILPITNYSAVVLQAPPYYATFFTSIIVNDVGRLPEEIVFKPKLITMEQNDMAFGDEEDPFGDMDLTPEVDIPNATGNIADDIFGNGMDLSPNDTVGDIGNDTGIQMDIDEPFVDEDQSFYGEDNVDGFEDQSYDTNQGYDNTEDSWQPEEFGDDTTGINMDGYEGSRSGDLPDYTTQGDASYIPGFDMEDESMGDDLYGNSGMTPDPYENVNDQEDMYGQYDPYNQSQGQNNSYPTDMPIAPEDNYDPLGQELYTDETQQGMPMQQEPNPYEMYDNPDMQPQQPYNPGFSPSDYEDEHTATSNRNSYRPQMPGRKHKGITSLLSGRQQEDQNLTMGSQNISPKDLRKVKDALKPFAMRGNSIVVTGCGGCGTSTIAFNLANIISQIGYTVLLVDMDTEGRTQGYISKASYDSMDTDGSNLMSAVNSSTNTNSNATVVKTGFHLLTMGLATDVQPIEEQLHKEKIARFVSVVKTGYNFVIYDVPFKHSIGFLSDITFMCDNLVLVTDASNWGVTKTMLSVCNIDSDDMQDTIFHRAQLVFNKYRNLNKLFGLRVKTCDDIVQAMDRKVLDLVGDDIGLQFSRMSIAGIVNDDPIFENGWYDDVQYSDTKKGQDVFIDLVESIVLKKH